VLTARLNEVPDALLRGPLRQLAQQDRAQAAPLPGVKDSDGHLGLVRLPGDADIPGHPHQLPGAGHHRDQSLMVAVVDAGEVGQALLGEVGFAGEEPPVTRGLAELVERLGKARAVIGAHWPDQHPVS
jgi:hypothetical protein